DELGAYPSPESEAVYLEILRSSAGGSDSEIERLATDGRRPESPPKNDELPRRGRGKVAPVIAGALLVGGKCDDCGATLPQYSNFCQECGHAVEATPSPATASWPSSAPRSHTRTTHAAPRLPHSRSRSNPRSTSGSGSTPVRSSWAPSATTFGWSTPPPVTQLCSQLICMGRLAPVMCW